jgi:Rrf2 family transcriptional regulator, iron-sulfur cluster assembly transcription factor
MLSNSCRYGIRAVIYLASEKASAGKTGIKQISKDLDLPSPFLAKILQQLAKQKILRSAKGPHGGFSLQKDPKKLTLYDIVISIDGDEVFTNCIMHNGSCPGVDDNKKLCPLHDDYSKTRNERMNLFRSKTIYDLAKRASNEDLSAI